jgi:hypothetical protein
MQRKVKGGLKNKGIKIDSIKDLSYQKAPKQENESAEFAKCDQADGKMSAPKISTDHKVVGKDN